MRKNGGGANTIIVGDTRAFFAQAEFLMNGENIHHTTHTTVKTLCFCRYWVFRFFFGQNACRGDQQRIDGQ